MSKKKHILVPRGFSVADADRQLTDRSNRSLFRHMTGTEAAALAEAGKIFRLGESGKIWQLRDDEFSADDSRPTGAGRVSREIPPALQSFVSSEMRRRRSWCVTIDLDP